MASHTYRPNHGASAVFSVYDSYVANDRDFSLLQINVTRDDIQLLNPPVVVGAQTVEAGWVNYPHQIEEPRLFTYYTTDGYAGNADNVGGWNQGVKGWVQTDSTYFPGTVFKPTSVDGGQQYEIKLQFVLYEGNWWLYIIDRWMGYYPGSLFKANVASPSGSLATQGSHVLFYGEVYQNEAALTSTDMGSRRFASEGYGHSAYIHNMHYIDTTGTVQFHNADFWDADSKRYNHDTYLISGTTWGSYVYLGGPGEGNIVDG